MPKNDNVATLVQYYFDIITYFFTIRVNCIEDSNIGNDLVSLAISFLVLNLTLEMIFAQSLEFYFL